MRGTVGVDIGGSGVRAAVVTDDGIGPLESVPMDAPSLDDLVEAVARAVAPLSPSQVGVGVPGFVRDGTVLGSPNLPALAGQPLQDRLEARLGVPVRIENDANAATLGVWAARGRREDLVVLTLGTGVGGGVVTDGRLLRGASRTGGEVGHLFAGGDRPCGCGGSGCLETWISTVGLVAAAAERGRRVGGGAEVVAAADAGEAWALAVCDAAADALGRGLVTLVNLFAPDAVVVLGGLAAARHRFGDRAEALLRARAVPPSVAGVRLAWGGRADAYAIAGAAEVARVELG